MDDKEYGYKDLDVNSLKLDKQNPRLPRAVRDKDDYEILKKMWTDFSLEELIISILQNGFIPAEPLMVIKDDNGYVVVEGNRRLSAVKLLTDEVYRNDDFFKNRLSEYCLHKVIDKLPCYIFKSRKEIETALAVRHIKGIKTWDSKEKAEYASMLLDEYKHISKVNKIIGSKTNSIGSLVFAYRWLEYITSKENTDESIKKFFDDRFSLLALALGQNTIKENFLAIDKGWKDIDYNIDNYIGTKTYNNMILLLGWLSNRILIPESRYITRSNNSVSLASILGNEEARNYLISATKKPDLISTDTLQEAYLRIDLEDTIIPTIKKLSNDVEKIVELIEEKKNNDKNFSDDTIRNIIFYMDAISEKINKLSKYRTVTKQEIDAWIKLIPNVPEVLIKSLMPIIPFTVMTSIILDKKNYKNGYLNNDEVDR